jgi:hypothetical protein
MGRRQQPPAAAAAPPVALFLLLLASGLSTSSLANAAPANASADFKGFNHIKNTAGKPIKSTPEASATCKKCLTVVILTVW